MKGYVTIVDLSEENKSKNRGTDPSQKNVNQRREERSWTRAEMTAPRCGDILVSTAEKMVTA